MYGKPAEIEIPENALAFTYCQVPFLYIGSDEKKIRIHLSDGNIVEEKDNILSQELSQELFRRSGKIEKIEVFIKK